MISKRINGFDKRMQQFTEISFSTNKYLRAVNIVVRADGSDVGYYKRHVTGELLRFYGGKKKEFLVAFSGLHVNKWKKRYLIKERCLSERIWELSIKFSDGKIIRYRGENAYPENFRALDKLLLTDYAVL